MLERWEPYAATGEPLDIDVEMMQLALAILGQALFGTDLSGRAGELVRATLAALDHLIHRARNPLGAPAFIPTRRNRRFRAARQQLGQAADALIRERRQALANRGDSADTAQAADLLGTLVSARDETTGGRMDEQALRDEILTMLIAGHETVASALTWTWHLLAAHPEKALQMRAELSKVLGGRAPEVTDLPELPYTKMVFEEALRLYPPAWLITRKALAEDEIECGGRYTIPAGSLVAISPYLIHRHPQFWENPEAFEPARFALERTAGRLRFAYIPFGGGPRLCIGDGFARLEAQLVLATVAQRFRLEALTGRPVVAEPLVTLRPRGGLPMRVVAL
jgi:cytochrome P450